MTTIDKPFVQLAIEQVDTVIEDRQGHYDPARHDRYETFETARDAALTSIEVMLDEADYDGEDHLEELEKMRDLLESSSSFFDLQSQAGYQWFLKRLVPDITVAA
jgi:hypothetical protein